MKIKKQKFGLLSDGKKAYLYTISNGNISFSVTNYGCIITSIIVPGKDGVKADIALGSSTFEGVVSSSSYFGAMVGRFANRIGGSKFLLHNNVYNLCANDNGNCLHGGFPFWDKVLWDAEIVKTSAGSGVCFTRVSPDGEQGMPGNLKVSVTYILSHLNEIIIKYTAVSDKDTPVNFTNHSYFNLAGQTGTIENHVLTMNCPSYLEVDKNLIPTGKIIPVDNTIFDFREGKSIGKDLLDKEIEGTGGYDHCYCISHNMEGFTQFATVFEPESGRKMSVSTDLPGVQFYSGNSLNGTKGKNGMTYKKYSGFCLETQYYPDSPNKPEFPSCILKAGEKFKSTTIYKFEW